MPFPMVLVQLEFEFTYFKAIIPQGLTLPMCYVHIISECC